jgi:hypothetical protein
MEKEPQISPLRFASVETTNWLPPPFSSGRDDEAVVDLIDSNQLVVSTEAKRSGEICGFSEVPREEGFSQW